MLLTPATVGTKVRTIGTKRARTIVFDPCLAKNISALATLAGLNRPALRPVEQRRAELVADEVADLVAGDGRERTHARHDRQRRHVVLAELLEGRVGREEPGEEQQRVARQEEPDQQTGLGEHDRREGDPARRS